MTVALQECNRAAEQAVAHSERTYPQFINGQALSVALRAVKQTKKADASRIVYALVGNVRTKVRVSRKTGKRVATRQYDVAEESLAARIVNARLVERGEKPIFGKELVKAVKRMIGARLRAVAFIRSGWIYAIRTLSATVGYSARPASGEAARMRGQAKGYARPARSVLSGTVAAEIGNTALIHEQRNPMPVAQRGLELALRETARDMMEHLRKKLQPICTAVSAK